MYPLAFKEGQRGRLQAKNKNESRLMALVIKPPRPLDLFQGGEVRTEKAKQQGFINSLICNVKSP